MAKKFAVQSRKEIKDGLTRQGMQNIRAPVASNKGTGRMGKREHIFLSKRAHIRYSQWKIKNMHLILHSSTRALHC